MACLQNQPVELPVAIQRTLSIIKPDAVRKGVMGKIISRLEENALTIVDVRLRQLSTQEAELFYAVHRDRPFFNDLVNFMISGPTLALALEGEDAIQRYRDLMGATDPKRAAPGTLRAEFADSVDANAVHGSDSETTAQAELAFFFPDLDSHSGQ